MEIRFFWYDRLKSPQRKRRVRKKRDTREIFPKHVKPYKGLLCTTRCYRALVDRFDYDGERHYPRDGTIGLIVSDAVYDGVFQEQWRILLEDGRLVWIGREQILQFLS